MVERSHVAEWLPQLYEPFRKASLKVADWFAPRSDAAETNDHYEISIELPGVTADDIDVAVHADTLTVRGEKRLEKTKSDKNYVFTEREYGSFRRTFRLPADADAESVDAAFEDGVLTLQIAKLDAPKSSARKIEVQSGPAKKFS